MPLSRFLQAGMAVLASLLLAWGGAGEAPGPTRRQVEILEALERSRPEWAEAGGIWMLGSWDEALAPVDWLMPQTGGGEAGQLFHSLEESYGEEAAMLAEGGTDSRGVHALLRAAEMEGCRLTPEPYPVYDSLESKLPDFVVYRRYLDALLRRGEEKAGKGEPEEAARCFRSGLLCGMHLMRDRSSSLVYATGLLFQLHAARAYESFLAAREDRTGAEAAARHRLRMEELFRAYSWKSSVALGEMAGFACLPAAIRIALEDAEPFWRKEAVLRLARLRYGVPEADGGTVLRHPGFEGMADRALSRVAASDPDPSVRRFAVWCAANLGLDMSGREQRFMTPE